MSPSRFEKCFLSNVFRRPFFGPAFVLCLFANFIGGSAQGQVIDTGTAWVADGSSTFSSPFGDPVYAAWGQTFVTPAGFASLDSFSIWLQDNSDSSSYGSDNVDFVAKVYQWDTTALKLTGPALYTSSMQQVNYSPTPQPFQEFTFQTGGLVLDPTKTYIFFLSANDFLDSAPGAANVGGGFNYDAYTGGGEYISDTSSAGLSTTAWQSNGAQADMAFIATFSAVPEPSSYQLAGATLLVFLAWRWRTRRVALAE